MDDVQTQKQQSLMPLIGCQIITNVNGCKLQSVFSNNKKNL